MVSAMSAVVGMAGSSEALLMGRMAAGDDSALVEVYDRFSPFVYGLARRVSSNSAAAEEILQDVFVGAWKRPDAFDPSRGSLRSYLVVITHRRAVDWIRRERSARRRQDSEIDAPPPPAMDDVATARVMAQTVRQAVASLPDDQREAVQLAYFGGYTYREVAGRLGIAEGTAKSRLRLALAKLAHILRSEGMTQWN